MSIHQALFWKSNLATGYKLYLWGTNTSGQLGLGDTVNRSSPVQLGSDSVWINGVNGGSSFFIKNDNTLWSTGANTSGQLGLGDTAGRSSPVQIGTLNNWSSVSTSMASQSDGSLWSWGSNNNGQLGLGDTVNRSSPVQIGTKTGWKSFTNCAGVVAAIDSTNALFTWGYNGNGELGLNDVTNRSSPTQVGSLTTWSKVATGSGGTHMGAIKTNGTLWMWGSNNFGCLGQGDDINYSSPVQVGSLTTWSKLTVGVYTTFAIKTDGTLWSWGANQGYGQLGLNDLIDRSSPVQIGTGTTWADVIANGSSTLAIKTDGTIWSWGNNGGGQLGLNDLTSRSSPVQIGTSNWYAIGRQLGLIA